MPTEENPFVLELDVVFHAIVESPLYGLFIRTADGIMLFGTNSEDRFAETTLAPLQPEGSRVTVCFTLHPHLCAGDYFLSIAVSSSRGDKEVMDRRHDAIHFALNQPACRGMVNMKPAICYVESNKGGGLA